MVRRSELEARIKVLVDKCDCALENVKKLKARGQSFTQGLNCEPSELKSYFLNSMKQLDEFIYLVTDFNLAMENLDIISSRELTPVHDYQQQRKRFLSRPPGLFDVLSEPIPSTSGAYLKATPISVVRKTKPMKQPKDGCLISFSSNSNSNESINIGNQQFVKETNTIEEEKLATNVAENLKLESVQTVEINLPAQEVLQLDMVYDAIIMHIVVPKFYIITETREVNELRMSMFNYYSTNKVKLTYEELKSMFHCAYYDTETDCWYRCCVLDSNKMHEDGTINVILVDIGESRPVNTDFIQPLVKQFFDLPPFARICQPAELIFLDKTETDRQKLHDVMSDFFGVKCKVRIEDNSSEVLYVTVATNRVMNDVLVEQGVAVPMTGHARGRDSAVRELSFETLTDSPEYDDVLEAVTGYHNKDETDICNFYNGGPEKTCFKGKHCKKRHVLKHPDGWTVDRVQVLAGGNTVSLPAPGSWVTVRVTEVAHYNRVYLQLVTNKPNETLSQFGIKMPLTTLSSLVREMNNSASRHMYKPLTMAPAPGEIVAAIYPPDNNWYRAKVLSLRRAEQSVQVRFVDYGNKCWVKESNISQLDPMYIVLPFQAIHAKLAGVAATTCNPEVWKEARDTLATLVLEKELDAQIISRSYDELEVVLVDKSGYSVVDQLAASNLIKLTEYTIQDDIDCPKKVIVQ